MKKDIATKLKERAHQIAKMYSLPDREKNISKELFSVKDIIPLSEHTAAVIYVKEPSKKKSIAFFYWVNMSEGFWGYFFPTDSHILGFNYFHELKKQIESDNYVKNF